MSYAIADIPKSACQSRSEKQSLWQKTSNLGALGRATYVVKTMHNDFRMPELAFLLMLLLTVVKISPGIIA